MTPTERAVSFSNLVVLIVDDDPIVREALARSLDESVHTIIQSDTGLQALELMRSVRVDAVIADLNMPGMNGIRLLVYVRDMYPDCVRLIMTAARSSDVEGLQTAGIEREQLLRKGIAPEELCRKVEALLREGAVARH